MQRDNGVEYRSPQEPTRQIKGAYVVPTRIALLAALLTVAVTPGILITDDHDEHYSGEEVVTCYAGETLADASEIISSVVCYYNPLMNRHTVTVVDGVVALTSAGAVVKTLAEIAAALPDASWPFSVLADVKFARSGTDVTIEDLDTSRRWKGIDPRAGQSSSHASDLLVLDRGFYRPAAPIVIRRDADAIANGDLLTDYPLDFYGRVRGHKVICDEAITTAGKTATLGAEIGAVAVGGMATALAGTKALGEVTSLTAPTGGGTDVFKPGDTLSMVASSVTAFVEGAVTYIVELEELVIVPGAA